MDVDLDGRVVVVTGGTRGIGRAVVEKLAANGAQLVFQGRDREASEKVLAATAAAGREACFVEGDLYDPEAAAGLVDHAVARFGHVDGAVGSGTASSHAADGSSVPGRVGFVPFREMDPEDIARRLQAGFLQRAYLAHAASRAMAGRGYGKIVLVTTDAGRVPTPGESVIGASAAALIFLTRALGRELARDGVRINAVGITLTTGTPGHDRQVALRERDDEAARLQVEVFRRIEARMPFGLGSAGEVAELVAFLLAPESDGVTGATLSVYRGGYFPTY